ncbi:AAA family ATPase [Streptomyces sp. LN245]|uniref:AAA family ATPase n=1 Tax=Streptomyces sp. LN245 TaxID=3112975 RepID=UPI00372348DF
MSLKGVGVPVPAHRLVALHEDDPERVRRFDTPFIGREQELAELRLLSRKLETDPRSHLVTVYGEAGLGKTRLLREWLRDCPAYGEGRCRPYGESGSLSPLAEAVRQVLAAVGEDTALAALPAQSGRRRNRRCACCGPASSRTARPALRRAPPSWPWPASWTRCPVSGPWCWCWTTVTGRPGRCSTWRTGCWTNSTAPPWPWCASRVPSSWRPVPAGAAGGCGPRRCCSHHSPGRRRPHSPGSWSRWRPTGRTCWRARSTAPRAIRCTWNI